MLIAIFCSVYKSRCCLFAYLKPTKSINDDYVQQTECAIDRSDQSQFTHGHAHYFHLSFEGVFDVLKH